jgi:hypothetical protein
MNMVRYTVYYFFSQHFDFPARDVYEWSTDFRTDDLARMGEEGSRKVEKLDEATLVLTDTVVTDGKKVTKKRLVRLFPDTHFWTNTRLSRVGRHSQFIYQVVAEGEDASRLEFTGALVKDAPRKPSSAQMAALSKKYADEDSAAWVNLAAAMKKELAPRRSRGASGNRAR